MIPCIKEKCLKYPICISKKAIRCFLLHKYYKDISIDGMSGIDAWHHIRKTLPKIGSISDAAEMHDTVAELHQKR